MTRCSREGVLRSRAQRPGFQVLRPRSSGSDAGEPGSELARLSDLAAEADVAVGPDGHQATAGDTGETVEMDRQAGWQGPGPARVPVQQHMHTWLGEQFVQPGRAP